MNLFKNGTVGPALVIHARQFTDRAAHMKEQLKRFEIPFEFVEPFDADTIDDEIRKRFLAPSSKLRPGQFSCSLKHVEAMRKIAASEHYLSLVLEDDVLLDERFHEELCRFVEESKSIDHPFTIQIGCASNMYVPKRLLLPAKSLYPADQVRAGDSYLIGRETARLRLKWLENNKIGQPPDHLFNTIDRAMGIRFYWSHPTIVVQGSANGMFRSSLDTAQMKKPLWLIRIRFCWQILRKKYIYRLFT